MQTLASFYRGTRRAFAGLATAAFVASAALPVHAHNLWLLPSSTVLSSPQWITVDAAVSNDLFHFNYVPLALDGLAVEAPDGRPADPQNLMKGRLRSVFDLNLDRPGTWRVSVLNRGVFASYRLDGERKRWRGRAADLDSQIPAAATELVVTESLGRIETFATVGKPSVLRASGEGLEMLAETHPNDLFAGEPARFRFTIDGKPAVGLQVAVIAGGTRYRDSLDDRSFVADADGRVEIAWPAPGLYWLEASAEDEHTSVPRASKRRLGYVATLEVLPQ